MKTFINCFKIAKKHNGVLYWRYDHYVYAPVRDLGCEFIFDFRKVKGTYGKMELPTEDRIKFYKLKQK